MKAPGVRPIAIGGDITQALHDPKDRMPLLGALRAAGLQGRDVMAEGWTLSSVRVFDRDTAGKVRLIAQSRVRSRTVNLDRHQAARWEKALRRTGVIA